jgi:hypothetical protein
MDHQDNFELDPNAAIGQPAAEMHEGAPAFPDAPGLETAPEQSTEPEIDWKAKYEADVAAWQQETVAERQRREALEIQQQQLLAQAGQAAWQQEEARAQQHASTLDYDSALAFMQQFYRAREARTMQYAQSIAHSSAMENYVGQVISYWGLNPTDRVRLGNDPNQMNAIAESIVAERQSTSSEVAQLRKELEHLKRGQQAQAALNNPAYRQGGARPAGALPPEIEKGSIDHLRVALGLPL